MKKVKKGTAGYILYERKKRTLLTIGMFLLPLGLYVIGYLTTKTRLNMMTFLAILGCLPACKMTVSTIMIWLQKPAKTADLEAAAKAAGNLIQAQELVITAYEQTAAFSSIAICGDEIIGFAPREETDLTYIEKYVTKIMAANHFPNARFKAFKEINAYCQRASHLYKNQDQYRKDLPFTPDERYPDLSREEIILHILYAIAL